MRTTQVITILGRGIVTLRLLLLSVDGIAGSPLTIGGLVVGLGTYIASRMYRSADDEILQPPAVPTTPKSTSTLTQITTPTSTSASTPSCPPYNGQCLYAPTSTSTPTSTPTSIPTPQIIPKPSNAFLATPI